MPVDSQNLAQAVVRLARRLRQERHSDLTTGQLSVLGTIRIHGSLTSGAIARFEHVRPPSMTRTINCLAESGLVNRNPNPDDGREVVISISEKGETVLALERARRDQWIAQQMAELHVADRQLLRDATAILAKLANS